MSCIASSSKQQLRTAVAAVGCSSPTASFTAAKSVYTVAQASRRRSAPSSRSLSTFVTSSHRRSFLAKQNAQASGASTASSSLVSGRRQLHSLPPLPEAIADPERGCRPFLSAETIQLIGNVWQGGLLQRLNDEVRGTKFETSSVVDTVVGAAQDRKMILAFNYASQALNNAFFLSNLRPAEDASKPNPLPPKPLLSRIEEDFDSLPAFKSAFSAAALGMMSSGWVWLVRDQTGRLGIVPTFGAGTVLVQDRMQRGNKDFQASVEESVARAAARQAAAAAAAAPPAEGATPASSPAESSSPSGTRGFSTSARAAGNYAPTTGVSTLNQQFYGAGANRFAGARDKAQIGQQLTPLLVLSVQEHAWLPDYGMWGKETYLMNFWECVDWHKVGRAYDQYATGKLK